MAARVNLSATPVFERVKKLEKQGYIKNYVAILDAEKLEMNLTVFCSIT
jgi:Lrp/AsnC family leucine-responsive transcriptional regulator